MTAVHGTWTAVCGRCIDCGARLAFMEGPMCDGCLDALEAQPFTSDDELLLEEDVGRKTRDVSRPRAEREDLELEAHADGEPRDRLAVNLYTREVIFFRGAA